MSSTISSCQPARLSASLPCARAFLWYLRLNLSADPWRARSSVHCRRYIPGFAAFLHRRHAEQPPEPMHYSSCAARQLCDDVRALAVAHAPARTGGAAPRETWILQKTEIRPSLSSMIQLERHTCLKVECSLTGSARYLTSACAVAIHLSKSACRPYSPIRHRLGTQRFPLLRLPILHADKKQAYPPWPLQMLQVQQ
jgi:hypothetical protein